MKSPILPIYPVLWNEDKVLLIDQTLLPHKSTLLEITSYEDMAKAIKTMIVRGAPAIGIAAAYGMCLGAREIRTKQVDKFLIHLETVAQKLRETRPTAVNLFFAISLMLKTAYESVGTVEEIKEILLKTAQTIQTKDLQSCHKIGQYGLEALPNSPQQLTLLTHCNAGALATAGYGTALGVIRSAWTRGRLKRVYADETRPRLQGAKLTAWECVQEGIPVTVISDNMAAHCMKLKKIDAVVVGADRIAANGDTANKIGTYALAVVAKMHSVPFFVAAPLSTIDFDLENGDKIPIEERHPS
ncbi:MAG: S-methyl-5-thioribose-1-phosphate isomerase, partial [cyanobacterium endosymbiont of Rhopalodia inflata]